MVEISNAKERCFAKGNKGCQILSVLKPDCNPKCPFYKPTGCEDWVRRERGDEIWLIPPDEYGAERAAKK